MNCARRPARYGTRRHGVFGASGFSLIEILTAVGVVAVIAAIGVPQLAVYSAQYRLQNAAQQLGVDLARARMKAIGENLFVRGDFTSQFSGSVAQGATYRWSVSNDGVTYASIGSTVTLPRGVRFYSLPQAVRFDRQGMPNAPLTLWAYNERGQWRVVTLNSIGKVTVQ